MKKSDFAVVAVLYAITIWFTAMTLDFPEEAQLYPLTLLSAIFFLTTLYLVLQLLRWKRTGVMEDDLKKSFEGFLPVQFFVNALLAAGYLIALHLLGYYPASLLYLIIALVFLKIPVKYTAATVVVLMAVIWAVFTWFLRVPLPAGVLFS